MTRVIQLSDREVVLTEDIGPVIQAWAERQSRTFAAEWGKPLTWNHAKGGYIDAYVSPFPPLARLAQEAEIDARDIYSIIKQERVCIDFFKADRILHAIDESVHHFQTYPATEVHSATMEQTAIIRNLARARGDYIPPGKAAKTAFPRLRKQYLKAA